MHILIIEDEPLVAKDIIRLIAQVAPEMKVLAQLSSVEQCINWFKQNDEPDLIFADIQLSDGVSFDIFKEVSIQCPVVFTTAYSEYAIRAFQINSIDYLLKPVDAEDLKKTVEKFYKLRSYASRPDFSESLADLLKDISLKDKKRFKERFSAHYGNAIVPVDASQISCFFREELIFILTTENKRLITDYHSLEELEDLLDPTQFYRANRQSIVHIDAIESFKSHFTGKLMLNLKADPSRELGISREKAGAFRQWFEKA